MHNNFETLEKKCRLYYLKQKLKIIIPMFFISIIILVSSMFFNKEEKQIIVKKESVKIIEHKNPKIKTIKEKETIDKNINIPKIKKIKVIKKTKRIIKDVKYTIQLNNDIISNKKIFHTKYKKNNKKKEKIIEPLQITKTTKISKKTTNNFSISTKKLESTKDMITLYNKENDYDLALKIAQRYYDSKKYSTALLWTKKANILNRKADGAWLLYAKSEYAKGNYKRAIEILNLYLANANSKEGESLLITWTQGK